MQLGDKVWIIVTPSKRDKFTDSKPCVVDGYIRGLLASYGTTRYEVQTRYGSRIRSLSGVFTSKEELITSLTTNPNNYVESI